MAAEIAVPANTVQVSPKIAGRWKSAFSLTFANMMDNNEGTGFVTSMFPLIRAQLGLTLGMLGWMAALPKIMAVNAAFITLIYKSYASDVQALRDYLAGRKNQTAGA